MTRGIDEQGAVMTSGSAAKVASSEGVSEERLHGAASLVRRLDEEAARDLAAIFQALGDPMRARIVSCLLHEELSTRDLAELTGITESAVSQHMRILRALRLVKSRRSGKQVFH